MANRFMTKISRIHKFSINGAGKNGYQCAEMTLNIYLALYAKINSKQIKDLKIRPEIAKFLEENIRETLMTLI